MRLGRYLLVVVLALALGHWHASAVLAQELLYSHGAAIDGHVRTNRSHITIDESIAHANLESSSLKVELQPGDNHLFVFEFDAECMVVAANLEQFGSTTGFLSVQARLNGYVSSAGVSFLQPQDSPTDLQACDSSRGPHTISKSWVIRLSNNTSSAVFHTFSIWVRTVDRGQSGIVVRSVLDNRTVRLTRYN
jgi:hypothetical protein